MIHTAIWIACFIFLCCLALSVLAAMGSVVAGYVDVRARRRRPDNVSLASTSSIPTPSHEELARFVNNYSLLSFRQRGIQK